MDDMLGEDEDGFGMLPSTQGGGGADGYNDMDDFADAEANASLLHDGPGHDELDFHDSQHMLEHMDPHHHPDDVHEHDGYVLSHPHASEHTTGLGLELEEGPPQYDEDLLLLGPMGDYDNYSATGDEVPIGDRLYLKGQEAMRRRQEKLERAQAEQAAKETEENMQKPQICATSNIRRSDGDFNKFYKIQEEWLQRRNRMLDKKRDMEKEEDLSVDRNMKASRKSNRILAGRHKGPIQAWDQREQHFRAVHTEEKLAAASFKPTISPAAQNLRRKGTVTTRLYDSAKSKKVAESPRANGKKVTDDQVKTLLQKMHASEETARRKFEGKLKSLKEEEGPFMPVVNERSNKILDRQGGHIPIHKRTSRAAGGGARPAQETLAQQRSHSQAHSRPSMGHTPQAQYVLQIVPIFCLRVGGFSARPWQRGSTTDSG